MMFAGARPTLPELNAMPFPMFVLPYISFLRWACEGLYITEVRTYINIYNITPGLEIWGYNINNFALDLLMLLTLGVALRIFAFLALVLLNRDKKK